MKKIILSTFVLLALDFLWVYFGMRSRYKTLIPSIQNKQMSVNYGAAVCAYVLMVVGLQLFVIPRLDKDRKVLSSFTNGFIFGVVLYGVYNFTCGTVFENWDYSTALLDVFWGGMVYFLTSIITLYGCKFIIC